MTKKHGVNIKNGMLCLYNQFPRDYCSIKEMSEYLPRIAEMHFNAVWINPIQRVGGEQRIKWLHEGEKAVCGSLYAMSSADSGDFFFEGAVEDDLRFYTEQSRRFGITPIFDLVLNQVAKDSSLYSMHKCWFKLGDSFPDCVEFDYNGKYKKDIMVFWKGYIRRYIDDYGFMGVRVDAVKHIPVDVQREVYDYIKDIYQRKFGDESSPIIFVELLLGHGEHEKLEGLMQQYNEQNISHVCVSHVTGNAYWDLLVRCDKSEVGAYLDNMGRKSKVGAVVEFTGNHDELTLFGKIAIERLKKTRFSRVTHEAIDKLVAEVNTYSDEQELLMKKKIALVALMSNGGYFLLGGDEFGDSGMYDDFIGDGKKFTKLVFDCHVPSLYHKPDYKPTYDLRRFIRNINDAITALPESCMGDWMEYVAIDKFPSLVVIVRHGGMGFVGNYQLVLVNIDDSKFELSVDIVRIIDRCREEKHRTHCPLSGVEKLLVLGSININLDIEKYFGAKPIIINEFASEEAGCDAAAPSLEGIGSPERMVSYELLQSVRLLGFADDCLKDVLRDGHCLFHAILHQLANSLNLVELAKKHNIFGDSLENVITLRAMVVSYLRENCQQFSAEIIAQAPHGLDTEELAAFLLSLQDNQDPTPELAEKLEPIFTRLANTSDWGDNLQISILARVLGLNAIVVTNNEYYVLRNSDPDFYGKTICLAFDRGSIESAAHYYSIVDVELHRLPKGVVRLLDSAEDSFQGRKVVQEDLNRLPYGFDVIADVQVVAPPSPM